MIYEYPKLGLGCYSRPTSWLAGEFERHSSILLQIIGSACKSAHRVTCLTLRLKGKGGCPSWVRMNSCQDELY